MRWWIVVAMLVMCGGGVEAQTVSGTVAARPKFEAFEVATIKPTKDGEPGRYIKMATANRFVAKDYTLKLMIAAAYELNPKTISGSAGWMESEHFDITAVTPGAVRPTHDEQMTMLRALIVERFGLKFHREQKEFSIYALELAKGGAKLKDTRDPEQPPVMGPGVVHPGRIVLPGRNATVGELASLLQRAIVDRPVVDRTGLKGRYDFDLEWAPDESQFGGDVPAAPETAPALPLFEAIEQQLGLRLEAMRGPVSALAVESARRPSEN